MTKDIVIESLSFSYGENLVIDRFSRTFAPGSRNCFMGASGCGKTTLLNIILGLIPPGSGRVYGVPEKITAVFQEDRLIESLDAADNLRLVTGKSKSASEIRDLLGLLGLEPGQPVSEFSGGMKRRVAIARALIDPGDLVVMDEPFKGLDEITKAQVINVINDKTAGKTLLVVTHDPSEAALLNTSIIEL